jgi:formylglycine-generating enzyme required for sulfatase activity
MDNDANQKLNDLFNKARNEPSQVSFEATKDNFLNNIGGIPKAYSLGGKIAASVTLKGMLSILISSIIILGTAFLLYNNLKPINKGEHKMIKNKEMRTDSALIVDEHDKVVKDYLERVEAIKVNFPLELLVPKELATQLKDVSLVQEDDTLKKKLASKDSDIEVDTSYRFPHLNYEELKAQRKQMIKMFGKPEKRKVGKEDDGIWYQSDPEGFLFIPMGKIEYNKKEVSVPAFYMKQTEVTNLEYRTFLFDLLEKGKEEDFLIAKPDQKMWTKEYPWSYNEPMVENYFSHPAYNDYPVVGMSRKGAEMYCKWFTEELNKVNQNSINNVRLPTDYEWMYAASSGDKFQPYPWVGSDLTNEKGEHFTNFMPKRPESYRKEGEKFYEYCYICDGAFHTAKVKSYPPNEFGLYEMSGNVAEMIYYVDEKNTPGTKGGSWTSIGQELQIKEGNDRFKGKITPSVNIGFRPVITFLGTTKNNNCIKPSITITPPGTVKLSNNLYFDKTEISNFMWQEYVQWKIKSYGKGSKEHIQALPDTLVWKSKLTYNEPYVQFYFSHPAYRNYPVVGITYEQAVAFCKWRTDRVKELFEIQQKTDKKNVYPTNFEYRLPTKLEWERMANIGYSEKMMKKIVGKFKGESLANYKKDARDDMESVGNLKDNADITAPVESYFPNALGCYNLIGNVTEMINEKGIAKGGAWIHNEKEITIEKDIKYTQQNAWTGFRCVCELTQ